MAAFLARLGCWLRTAPSRDELPFQSMHMLADIGLQPDGIGRCDVRAHDQGIFQHCIMRV
jgi:uncharacterized protein YjiS (DUF1127 family)